MKTLILCDENGKIVLITQGNDIGDSYKCIVTDIEDNKIPVSVNTETGEVVTKDKPLSLEEQNEILTDQIIELKAQNLINN